MSFYIKFYNLEGSESKTLSSSEYELDSIPVLTNDSNETEKAVDFGSVDLSITLSAWNDIISWNSQKVRVEISCYFGGVIDFETVIHNTYNDMISFTCKSLLGYLDDLKNLDTIYEDSVKRGELGKLIGKEAVFFPNHGTYIPVEKDILRTLEILTKDSFKDNFNTFKGVYNIKKVIDIDGEKAYILENLPEPQAITLVGEITAYPLEGDSTRAYGKGGVNAEYDIDEWKDLANQPPVVHTIGFKVQINSVWYEIKIPKALFALLTDMNSLCELLSVYTNQATGNSNKEYQERFTFNSEDNRFYLFSSLYGDKSNIDDLHTPVDANCYDISGKTNTSTNGYWLGFYEGSADVATYVEGKGICPNTRYGLYVRISKHTELGEITVYDLGCELSIITGSQAGDYTVIAIKKGVGDTQRLVLYPSIEIQEGDTIPVNQSCLFAIKIYREVNIRYKLNPRFPKFLRGRILAKNIFDKLSIAAENQDIDINPFEVPYLSILIDKGYDPTAVDSIYFGLLKYSDLVMGEFLYFYEPNKEIWHGVAKLRKSIVGVGNCPSKFWDFQYDPNFYATYETTSDIWKQALMQDLGRWEIFAKHKTEEDYIWIILGILNEEIYSHWYRAFAIARVNIENSEPYIDRFMYKTQTGSGQYRNPESYKYYKAADNTEYFIGIYCTEELQNEYQIWLDFIDITNLTASKGYKVYYAEDGTYEILPPMVSCVDNDERIFLQATRTKFFEIDIEATLLLPNGSDAVINRELFNDQLVTNISVGESHSKALLYYPKHDLITQGSFGLYTYGAGISFLSVVASDECGSAVFCEYDLGKDDVILQKWLVPILKEGIIHWLFISLTGTYDLDDSIEILNSKRPIGDLVLDKTEMFVYGSFEIELEDSTEKQLIRLQDADLMIRNPAFQDESYGSLLAKLQQLSCSFLEIASNLGFAKLIKRSDNLGVVSSFELCKIVHESIEYKPYAFKQYNRIDLGNWIYPEDTEEDEEKQSFSIQADWIDNSPTALAIAKIWYEFLRFGKATLNFDYPYDSNFEIGKYIIFRNAKYLIISIDYNLQNEIMSIKTIYLESNS